MKKAYGWKAKLIALEGLLLSGNAQDVSKAYESKESALDWVRNAIRANLEDRRKVKFAGFIEVNFVEIFDADIYEDEISDNLADELHDTYSN